MLFGPSWQRSVLTRLASSAVLVVVTLIVVSGNASKADEKRTRALEMGARLVEARCTFCHKQKALPELVDRCMAQHGAGYLDQFLKRHYAPDDAARADIIAYLTCPPDLVPPQ